MAKSFIEMEKKGTLQSTDEDLSVEEKSMIEKVEIDLNKVMPKERTPLDGVFISVTLSS